MPVATGSYGSVSASRDGQKTANSRRSDLRRTTSCKLMTAALREYVLKHAYQLIAEQMGHTNENMIRQHCGTWINEDGPDVVGMLQLALKLSPATAPH